MPTLDGNHELKWEKAPGAWCFLLGSSILLVTSCCRAPAILSLLLSSSTWIPSWIKDSWPGQREQKSWQNRSIMPHEILMGCACRGSVRKATNSFLEVSLNSQTRHYEQGSRSQVKKIYRLEVIVEIKWWHHVQGILEDLIPLWILW